jgi:putative transcriptional regulator
MREDARPKTVEWSRPVRVKRPATRAACSAVFVALLFVAGAAPRPWAGAAVGPPAGPTARPVKGKLLVSGHSLGDPNFAETVVLLLAVDEDNGAMGVIVNQPTPIKLGTILPDSKPLAGRGDRVWRGGPVLPTSLLVLVRAKTPPAGAETVFEDVQMLTSRDAVRRSLMGHTPRERMRAYAGHAGWGPGQLEAEIDRGDWTLLPGDSSIVFSEAPETVWPKLIERAEGQWTRLPGDHHSDSTTADVCSVRGRTSG